MRYEEYLKTQLGKLKEAGVIATQDLPEMDLYIDQVSTVFRKFLDKLDDSFAEKYVTKPMINNYVKRGQIARPDGKRYTKDHMVMIAMVIYLRSIFKMEDISKIMKPLIDNYSSAYDDTISPELVYALAQEATENRLQEFLSGIDESVSVIKREIEDTDLADDQSMEVLVLILTLAMRAEMEKYLAERLMKVYFEQPEKEKKEKPKRQKSRAPEKEKNRDDDDNLSEL
jgi:hypothetical protein